MQLDTITLHASIINLHSVLDSDASPSAKQSAQFAIEVLHNLSKDMASPEGLFHWQLN
jgi:hypothetical protein